MNVIAQVRRFIRRHDLIRPDTRVVCALSGGSDSVALAAIVRQLHDRGELRAVGLAHLNHQLRPTADRDEQFCRELAGRLALPIVVERVDVAARAARDRRSIETAAHDARHAFFRRAIAQVGGDVVALGHTRDDQAETVLLRLLRGAGPRGLAAMYPRRGFLVRPLLAVGREELRVWVDARGLRFVDDETNADVSIPRNRVRTELLPRLAEFNPNIVSTLAREADLFRDVWGWLAEELAAFGPELDVARLRLAPRALQRLAVWRALGEQTTRPVTTAHVDAVMALVDAADEASVDVPGVRVHRIASRIVLTKRVTPRSRGSDAPRPSATGGPRNLWRFPLSIPGEVALHGLALSAELAPLDAADLDRGAIVGSGPVAAVRADLVASGLAVRGRRPGDRFRPIGLRGRKKLQDLFVDRKIVRAERDAVPLVVDDRDRIVWVAGHGIDEAFRVTDASQKVVVLKLRFSERCS